MSGVEDIPALPKAEHSREASSSSIASTPEPDAETFAQENAQVQKRKGGRKPVSQRSWCGFGEILTAAEDIRYFRREEATEPPGSSRLPGTTDRVYQTVGDDDQAS